MESQPIKKALLYGGGYLAAALILCALFWLLFSGSPAAHFSAYDFVPVKNPSFSAAAEPAPLVVRDAGRDLLVFVTRAPSLTAVDVASGKSLWQIPLGTTDMPGNSPIFDPKSRRIFLRERHALVSVALDGTKFERWRYSLDKILGTPNFSKFSCHTGSTLLEIGEERRIVFGCSVFPYEIPVSGFLLAFPIDKSGAFLRNKLPDYWLTNPKGHGGGIWMSGAPPAVLDDGSILVTTGNAPFSPGDQAFGCSLVRLKLGKSNLLDLIGWYHPADLSSTECYAENLDLSSSGPVLQNADGKTIASFLGKDGSLKILDAKNLPGVATVPSQKILAGNENFGQVGLLNKDKELHLVFASAFWPTVKRQIHVFSSRPEIRDLPRKQSAVCVGFAKRAGKRAFAHLYAGSRRLESINLPVDSPEFRGLMANKPPKKGVPVVINEMVKGRWLPFEEIGERFSLSRGNAPEGFHERQLTLFRYALGNLTGYQLVWRDELEKYVNLPGFQPLSQPGAFLVPDKGNPDCGKPPAKDYLPIYEIEYSFNEENVWPADWFAAGYRVNPKDLTAAQTWIYKREEKSGEELFHSNFGVVQSGKSATILLPVKAKDSYLLLLDAFSGRERGRLPLPGEVHFSYPVISGKFIFVPTVDRGLIVYKAKPNFLKWLRWAWRSND